jgi:hypothetical protein
MNSGHGATAAQEHIVSADLMQRRDFFKLVIFGAGQ